MGDIYDASVLFVAKQPLTSHFGQVKLLCCRGPWYLYRGGGDDGFSGIDIYKYISQLVPFLQYSWWKCFVIVPVFLCFFFIFAFFLPQVWKRKQCTVAAVAGSDFDYEAFAYIHSPQISKRTKIKRCRKPSATYLLYIHLFGSTQHLTVMCCFIE